MIVNIKAPVDDTAKLKLITTICNMVQQHISLPDTVNVILRSMGPHVRGETVLTFRPQSTIILNSDLTAAELFYPTIHELVHIHQIHTRQLSVSRTGVYVWSGSTYIVDPQTISYSEYMKLPWEVDAFHQQEVIGKKLLDN